MLTRSLLLLAALLAATPMAASASSHHLRRHPLRASLVPPAPVPYSGPTLVLHPASNIACDTPFRSTRALPCDQPVWVYGNPCEIDLGLGRSRRCE
jgi:hypothetical protein